jgi:hypothetical protein
VRYPLELVVTEQRGGYRVALSHTASEPTVFLEAETPTRYRVIEFPQRMLAVQEILGRRGLTVPKSAHDRVVALVQRSNPTLPIRAEIEAVAQTVLDGAPAPVVQLLPYGEGLKVTLVVRPFGAEGPAYIAGLGGLTGTCRAKRPSGAPWSRPARRCATAVGWTATKWSSRTWKAALSS